MRILREDNGIKIKGQNCPLPFQSWTDLPDLPRQLLHNLEDNNLMKPTAIQMQAIPIGFALRDMIGLAPTGSGKSIAFLLPLVSFLSKLPLITGVTA